MTRYGAFQEAHLLQESAQKYQDSTFHLVISTGMKPMGLALSHIKVRPGLTSLLGMLWNESNFKVAADSVSILFEGG